MVPTPRVIAMPRGYSVLCGAAEGSRTARDVTRSDRATPGSGGRASSSQPSPFVDAGLDSTATLDDVKQKLSEVLPTRAPTCGPFCAAVASAAAFCIRLLPGMRATRLQAIAILHALRHEHGGLNLRGRPYDSNELRGLSQADLALPLPAVLVFL